MAKRPYRPKGAKIITRKKVIGVKVGTNNSSSGNPRRGWICYSLNADKLGFVDEGYSGSQAVDWVFPNNLLTTRNGRGIEITPKQYNTLRKNAVFWG